MYDPLENIFVPNALKEEQAEKCDAIRAMAKEIAYLIGEACPNGREKSLAMTKLEESVMWADVSMRKIDVLGR